MPYRPATPLVYARQTTLRVAEQLQAHWPASHLLLYTIIYYIFLYSIVRPPTWW